MTKRVYFAPEEIPENLQFDYHTLFLAGSIEMGKAEDWQTKLINMLIDKTDYVFFNPRRKDWDSSWIQSKDNPQFREQVEWEIKGLETANQIAVYFDPNTQSPITLLELGLMTKWPHTVVVCCPKGFYRKGNVDIVCEGYGIKVVETLEELADSIVELYNKDLGILNEIYKWSGTK